MEIEKGIIKFSDTLTVDYPKMKVIDLAHALILLAKPQLEIKLTDERKEQFIRDAAKAYLESRTAWDSEEFTKLYVQMATEKYFAIERANHAYNEMILAYDAKIKELIPYAVLFAKIQNDAIDYVNEAVSDEEFINQVLDRTSAQ